MRWFVCLSAGVVLGLVVGCSSSTPGPADATSGSDAQPAADSGQPPPADSGVAPDAGPEPSVPSDDLFDGNGLGPAWRQVRGDRVSASVTGGQLVVRMTGQALWFNADRGFLLHQPVTGDFRATARVRTRRTSDPSQPPERNVHLAGVMARDPASDQGSENYVFIVVGKDENDLSVETKTTRSGQSVYEGPSWPGGEAELRLCRVGAEFRLLKRPLGGGTWMLAQTVARPDLPQTLQVGLNVYTFAEPDLTATFEEIRFSRPTSAADCSAP